MSQSSGKPSNAAEAAPVDGPPQDSTRAARGADERGAFTEDLLLGQLGRCSIPLTLVLLMGVVRGVQDGFGSPQALVLLVGAFVSGVATFLYALPTVLLSYGRQKRPWMRMSAFGGIVAYAYGVFLILVPGLWDQVRAPSLAGAGSGLFFLLMGFWYLRSLGRLAELARRIERTLDSEAVPAEQT